jgi:hypothetical protein
MEEQIKKLREAGFTDADIEVFVNDQKSRAGQPQAVDPAQVDNSQPPAVDEKVPAYGAPPGSSILEDVATAGAAVAPYALPAALAAAGGGGVYGLYKFGSKALDVGRGVNEQMAQRNAIESAREARLANRPGFGGVPQTSQMPKPTAPMPGTPNFAAGAPGTAMPTTPYQVPTAGPVAPQPATMAPPAAAPAARAPAPSVMQRGTDIANQMRQFAAQRVIPVAQQAGQMAGRGLAAVANSPITRAGGMAANALYSGDLNANEAAELERRRKMAPTITR